MHILDQLVATYATNAVAFDSDADRAVANPRIIPAGVLLFHGTPEPIRGALRPSIDGLLWFADNPVIAQLYIPHESNTVVMSWEEIAKPLGVNSKELRGLQKELGIEYNYSQVKWINHWQLKSYPLPQGWRNLPSKAEIKKLMHKYPRAPHSSDYMPKWEIPVESAGGLNLRLRRKSTRFEATGTLFVLKTKRELRVADFSGMGGGRYSHLDFSSFQKAENANLDGVIIEDAAQSKKWGNLGHKSLGLFNGNSTTVVKRIPADYREWESGKHSTLEYPRTVKTWL